MSLSTTGDELRRGIAVRVGCEQAIDVRKQDEEVCPDRPGDDGGQRVVVTDAQLLRGDGVVFVDDRQRAQLQQPRKRVVEVFARSGVSMSSAVMSSCATTWWYCE